VRFGSGTKLEFEEKSEYEILTNTTSIIEQLKGKIIRFLYTDKEETNSKNHSGITVIKIPKKKDGVSAKTKLERELARVVFDSPTDEFMTHVKQIRTNTTIQQRQSFIKNIYTIYENLETRRVESCYGRIYRGANERFIEARQNDATKKFSKTDIPMDPIEALKLARFDQKNIVKKSEFVIALDYINAVEHTGRMGAFDLAIMYWEKVVQPFLKKKLQKPETENNNTEQAKDLTDSTSSDQMHEDDKETIHDKIKSMENELASVKNPQSKIILKEKLRELKVESIKEKYHGQLLLEFSEPIKIWSGQKATFEQTTKEHKEYGELEIAAIEKQLELLSKKNNRVNFSWNQIKNEIQEIKPECGKNVKINKNIALRLKNTFKNIQGGKHAEIDSTGGDIDVDSYIDYRINKIGNFYNSTRNFLGFDIVIAIDESGSMRDEMPKVRRMCATLYEAISGLPNVRLTIIGWKGMSNNCIIKTIIKAEQIGSLDAIGLTPIGKAIWYCKHVIDLQTSPKRLFILITDGEPNNLKDIDSAQECVKMMRKKGIICNGICVGADKFADFMEKIFGDQFEICYNYSEVDEFLRKKISRQIIHSLRVSKYL